MLQFQFYVHCTIEEKNNGKIIFESTDIEQTLEVGK